MDILRSLPQVTTFTACSCLAFGAAHADVTLEQSMKVDGLMDMLDMSGTMVTRIAGDRARTESNLEMQSRLLRMMTPDSSAEIVQLDAGTVYSLNLDKRTYTEMSLAEQRAAMQDSMEQMREAQSQQPGAGVDEADCEWSDPTAEVERPGDTDTIAGYQAERSIVTASQSCTDRRTGQVCSFNLVLDQWLAPEFDVGGEVLDFYGSYAEQLGLEVAGAPGFSQRLESMFGAYQGIWSEIAAEMEDAEGYPLRTTVSLAVGGPQCDTDQQAGMTEERPGINETVGRAVGGALGGIFGRGRDRKAEAEQEQAAEPAVTDATLPEGTARLLSISTELVRVSDEAVPPATFDVPEGFRKVSR